MSVGTIQIHGYAIVSDDDRIADVAGRTPLALHNEADWAYFQRELNLADFVALGRLAHEANPNVKHRRRLILSSAADGLEWRGREFWWNPAKTPWGEIASALLPVGGRLAVPGGQAVFDLFLRIGYAAFHLTRARGVVLPGGRALFAACDQGQSAEETLRGADLSPDPQETLDAGAHVSLTVWRKP